MKKMIFTCLLWLYVQNAQAVIVDDGAYNTDSDTGLQWLDLTATDGLTYSAVVGMLDTVEGGGWRFATNAEIEHLFSISFDGYYDTEAEHYSRSDSGAYSDQLADINAFVGLFGDTNDELAEYYESYGFYVDEDGLWRLLGGLSYRGGEQNWVIGPEYTGDYDSDVTGGGYYFDVGYYLVRNTDSVPEPSSLSLIGFGLFCLRYAQKRATS